MKKKICILTIELIKGGGISQIAQNLTKILSPYFEVFLIVYGQNKYYIKKFANAKVYWLGQPTKTINYIDALFKFLKNIKGIIKVFKILKTESPDAVFSMGYLMNFVNIICGRYLGYKIILSEHTYLPLLLQNIKFSKLKESFLKYFYPKATAIISIAKDITEVLKNKYNLPPHLIVTLPNPYNISLIQKLSSLPVPQNYRFIFKHPTIINIGRFTKVKGQWYLLRVFKQIKRELPNAKLILMGEGNLKNYLKKLTSHLQVERDVYFIDWQSNPFPFLKKSTLFVLTSIYEGFPNVLIEALACGCPIIASACKAGVEEIIDNNKYGILAPPLENKFYFNQPLTLSEKKLAFLIVDFMKSPKKYRISRQKLIQRAKEFDMKKIGKLYIKFLSKILRTPK